MIAASLTQSRRHQTESGGDGEAEKEEEEDDEEEKDVCVALESRWCCPIFISVVLSTALWRLTTTRSPSLGPSSTLVQSSWLRSTVEPPVFLSLASAVTASESVVGGNGISLTLETLGAATAKAVAKAGEVAGSAAGASTGKEGSDGGGGGSDDDDGRW